MSTSPNTVELVDPPVAGDERATLMGFLAYQRAVLLRKASGLTTEQLSQTCPPSDLSLGRLVRHMTFVESFWFNDQFLGRPPEEPWASGDWDNDDDWEMTTADGLTPDLLLPPLVAAIEASDEVVAAASLDALSHDDGSPRTNDDHVPKSLRWILAHMIEEYARHLGHADYLRQSIDGSVGD